MLILVREMKKKIRVLKIRRFVKDINSGKINNMGSASERYIKDILPDKKILETKKFNDETPSSTLKNI